MPDNNRGYLFAAATVALWSGFVLVSRLGGVSALSAFDITALRLATAAAVLLPVWLLRHPVRLITARMSALAVTGGLGYALLVYAGFKLTSAAHAAVLLPGLLPFGIAFMARALLDERASPSRWFGLLVIASGVGCLGLDAVGGETGNWHGDLLMLAASLCWALYTVLARRWAVAAWDATIGVVLISAIAYLPVYILFLPKDIASASWSAIAVQAFYQGVVAPIVAMVVYIKAISLIGATRMGTLMALVPAASGFAAAPLLGEPLSGWLIAGLALVSTGAYVGSLNQIPILRRKPCPT
jgi:drug/metabolite transporter (DMT)-like permease